MKIRLRIIFFQHFSWTAESTVCIISPNILMKSVAMRCEMWVPIWVGQCEYHHLFWGFRVLSLFRSRKNRWSIYFHYLKLRNIESVYFVFNILKIIYMVVVWFHYQACSILRVGRNLTHKRKKKPNPLKQSGPIAKSSNVTWSDIKSKAIQLIINITEIVNLLFFSFERYFYNYERFRIYLYLGNTFYYLWNKL